MSRGCVHMSKHVFRRGRPPDSTPYPDLKSLGICNRASVRIMFAHMSRACGSCHPPPVIPHTTSSAGGEQAPVRWMPFPQCASNTYFITVFGLCIERLLDVPPQLPPHFNFLNRFPASHQLLPSLHRRRLRRRRRRRLHSICFRRCCCRCNRKQPCSSLYLPQKILAS